MPPPVSRQWFFLLAPPFPPPAPVEHGSPLSSVLWRHYDVPPARPLSLIGFAKTVHGLPPLRSRRLEDTRRAGSLWSAGKPKSPARFYVDAKQDLSGSRAIHPVPLPSSKTPVEPTDLAIYRSHRCCPRTENNEGFDVHEHFGATTQLQHPLSTLHEKRCRFPCKTRFRPAGSPLPRKCRTRWIALKVSVNP